jgi:hypothetical protein
MVITAVTVTQNLLSGIVDNLYVLQFNILSIIKKIRQFQR